MTDPTPDLERIGRETEDFVRRVYEYPRFIDNRPAETTVRAFTAELQAILADRVRAAVEASAELADRHVSACVMLMPIAGGEELARLRGASDAAKYIAAAIRGRTPK